jgi:hypothetical protein
MFKIILYLFLFIFLQGCAAHKSVTHSHKVIPKIAPIVPVKSLKEVEKPKTISKGIIFFKTQFEGILDSSYVKLIILDRINPKDMFELYLSDQREGNYLPWEIKIRKNGYSYLRLPVGKYRIATVSVPVGTTQATEVIDINFDVLPGKVLYLGTLILNGTKEKIRLGGVPIIKPGFEYTVKILDEAGEAESEFRRTFPHNKNGIQNKVMVIISENKL